jgi:hypothetical protein
MSYLTQGGDYADLTPILVDTSWRESAFRWLNKAYHPLTRILPRAVPPLSRSTFQPETHSHIPPEARERCSDRLQCVTIRLHSQLIKEGDMNH